MTRRGVNRTSPSVRSPCSSVQRPGSADASLSRSFMAASPRGSFPTFPEASLIRPPAVPAEQVAAHPPAAPWRRGGAHAAVPRPPGAATSPSLAAGCLPRASSAWRRSGHVAAARRCVLIADGISAAARHTIRPSTSLEGVRSCTAAAAGRPPSTSWLSLLARCREASTEAAEKTESWMDGWLGGGGDSMGVSVSGWKNPRRR